MGPASSTLYLTVAAILTPASNVWTQGSQLRQDNVSQPRPARVLGRRPRGDLHLTYTTTHFRNPLELRTGRHQK